MLYDTLVVFGVWVFTVVLLVTIRGDAVVGAWVQSLLFIELFAFFAYFWLKRGQTVGMLAWRLRIVSDAPMTLRTVLLAICWRVARCCVCVCRLFLDFV